MYAKHSIMDIPLIYVVTISVDIYLIFYLPSKNTKACLSPSETHAP